MEKKPERRTTRRAERSSDRDRQAVKRKGTARAERSSGTARISKTDRTSKAGRTSKTERPAKTVKKTKQTRKKGGSIFGRILQIGLVVLLAIVLFYVVRNFGEGNKYNNKGMEAYNRADYETANTCFGKAVEYDEKNGEYHMNHGMAQSELKLYDEAMESFNKALEFTKRDKDIQLVHRAMGISLMYQGKYDEALESFNKALDGKESRFTDTEVDVLYYKAETEDKAGKYVESVMTYTKIVEYEKSADAYLLRGMAYVKVGDSTSAEADLRTAIKKDKKNYEIYMALYNALMDQNKVDDARAVLEEALSLGGSKGRDLVNQGNIYLKLGDYASAEERLKKALDKGEISAHLGYAELYMTAEKLNHPEAEAHFEAYLAQVTDDVEAYNKYGSYLMDQGNYAKAEEIFTRGVALNNRLMDRTISKNQVSAAEHAGNWTKALEYIEVYLQKYSDDADAVRERDFIQTRIR